MVISLLITLYEIKWDKNYFGLYRQVIKCTRWMPWQLEATKDVVACEKLRGGGNNL